MTRVLTVTEFGLGFPHAVQAVRILRQRTDLKAGKCTRQTVSAITNLASHRASPQRPGQLARSQWTIESRLHFVRDTSFHEDASKIHTGHGPTTWLPCGTSRSTRSATPDTATSLPAYATPPTSPSPARSTSCASPDQRH